MGLVVRMIIAEKQGPGPLKKERKVSGMRPFRNTVGIIAILVVFITFSDVSMRTGRYIPGPWHHRSVHIRRNAGD